MEGIGGRVEMEASFEFGSQLVKDNRGRRRIRVEQAEWDAPEVHWP